MWDRLKDSDKIYNSASLATDRHYVAHKWYSYRYPYVYFHEDITMPFYKWFNKACIAGQMLFPIFKRRGIGNLTEIYHAVIWGTYPRDAIEFVFSYLNSDPKFLKDLRTCSISEEFCLSTILMNSSFKDRYANNNLRYWKWEAGTRGPGYLDATAIPDLKKTDAFFARKIKANSEVELFLKDKVNK